MTSPVSYEIACRLIVSLMMSPKTRLVLAEDCECDIKTVQDWVRAMRKSGILYVHSWHTCENGHRSSEMYAFQKSPFEIEDVESPGRIRRKNRYQKKPVPPQAVHIPKEATWWGAT